MKLLTIAALALVSVEPSAFIKYLQYEHFWELRAPKNLKPPNSYQGLPVDALVKECSDLSVELTELKCAVVSSYLINKLAEDRADDELFDVVVEFRQRLLKNAKHDTTKRFLNERSYVQLTEDTLARLGNVFLDGSQSPLRLSEYLDLIKEDPEAGDWIVAFLRVKDIEHDPTPTDEKAKLFQQIFSNPAYFENPERYDARSMSVGSAMVRAGLGNHLKHKDIFWSMFAAICPNRSKSNCYAQHRYFGPLIAWKIASAKELYNYVVIEIDPHSDVDPKHPSKTKQSFTLEIDAKFLGSKYTEAELETYALSVWDRLSSRAIFPGLISRSFGFKPRSAGFCDIEFLPRRVVGALLQSKKWNQKFKNAVGENDLAFAYRAGGLIGKAIQLGLVLGGENATYLKHFQRCIDEEMAARFDLYFKTGLELALRLENLKYVHPEILKMLFYDRATADDVRRLLNDADTNGFPFEVGSSITKVIGMIKNAHSLVLNSLYGSLTISPYTVASKSLSIIAGDSNQSAVSKSTKIILARLLGTSAANALRPTKFYQTSPSHLVHAIGTPLITLHFKTTDKKAFESSFMALLLGEADFEVDLGAKFLGHDGAGPLTAIFDLCSEIRRLDAALAKAEAINGPLERLPELILIRWMMKTEYLAVHYVSNFHHSRCDDELLERFELIKTKVNDIKLAASRPYNTHEPGLNHMLNTESANLANAVRLRNSEQLDGLFRTDHTESPLLSLFSSVLVSTLQANKDPLACWAVIALVRFELLSDMREDKALKNISRLEMQEFLFLLPTMTLGSMDFTTGMPKKVLHKFIDAKLIDLEYFREFLVEAAKRHPEHFLLSRDADKISKVLPPSSELVNADDWLEDYELKLLSNTQRIQGLINGTSQALDSKAQEDELCTLGVFFGASRAYSFPISADLSSMVIKNLADWLQTGELPQNQNMITLLSCAESFYQTNYWKHLDLHYIRSNALIVISHTGKNILLKPHESLPWTLNLKETSLDGETKQIGKAFWQALEHAIDKDFTTFLSPDVMVKLPGTGIDQGGLSRQFFDVILDYVYDDALRLGPSGYVLDIFLSTDAAFKLGLLIGKVLQMGLTLPRKIDPDFLRLVVYHNVADLQAYYRESYGVVLENSVKESLSGMQEVYTAAESKKEEVFKSNFVTATGKGLLIDYRETKSITASLRSITNASDYLSLSLYPNEDVATIDSWSDLQKYMQYLFDVGEDFFLSAVNSFRKGLRFFIKLRWMSNVQYTELMFRKPISAAEFIALLHWEGNASQLIPSLLQDSNSKPLLISFSQAFESIVSVLNSDEIYEMVNMFTGSGKTSFGTLEMKRLKIEVKTAPFASIIPDFAFERVSKSTPLKKPYDYEGIVALFNKVAAMQQSLFSEKTTPIAFTLPERIGLFFAHTCYFWVEYGLKGSSSLSILLSIIYELGSQSSVHFSEGLR